MVQSPSLVGCFLTIALIGVEDLQTDSLKTPLPTHPWTVCTPSAEHCCVNRPSSHWKAGPGSAQGSWVPGLLTARGKSFLHLPSPTHQLRTGATQDSDGVWGPHLGPSPALNSQFPARRKDENRTKGEQCGEDRAPLATTSS